MPATAKPALETATPLWEPQEGPQKEFFYSRVYELMYGGAAGGGKSDGLLGVALRQIPHPQHRCLILRRTLKELKKAEGLIDKAHRMLHGVARWNGEDNTYTFPTGARLDFGYCDSDKDVYQFQGSGYNLIEFDELTRFTEFQYLTISGYCRSVHPGLIKMIRAATNPGNIGHAWVKKRFIDAMAPYEIVRSKNGLTRQFIPAKVRDNKILMERDPDYIKRLEALPEPWRTALLDGDWNIFMGQAFPEWSWDTHTCDAFELESWFPRLLCIDWGYTSKACALSLVKTPERSYFYREFYTSGMRPKDFAERLIDTHTEPSGRLENIQRVVLDRSCFAQTGSPQTIAEQMDEVFQRVGWQLEESDSRDRIGRKMLWHEYLRSTPLRAVKPRPPVDDYWAERFRLEGPSAIHEYEALGVEEVLPRLKIFRPSQGGRFGCPHLIRTLPSLVLDEKKVEDVDTHQEDHPYDAGGYGLKAMDYRAPKKPMEILLRERMAQVTDRSTIHLSRAAAEDSIRKQLTEGSGKRIFYRERPRPF